MTFMFFISMKIFTFIFNYVKLTLIMLKKGELYGVVFEIK